MKIDTLKRILHPEQKPLAERLRRKASKLASLASETIELFQEIRHPRQSVSGNTAHVQYIGVSPERLPEFQEALQSGIQDRPELVSVHVNPYTKRAVFSGNKRLSDTDALFDIVRDAEQAVDAADMDVVEAWERLLPDDRREMVQTAVEAAADLAAVTGSMAFKLVPFASKIPESAGKNLYAATFLVAHIPALREAVEERLGRRRTDFFVHLSYAAALGLSQRPLASSVSLLERLQSLRELNTRTRLWRSMMDDVLHADMPVSLTDLPVPRPIRPPEGPVERCENRTKMVATGAVLFSLVTTRNPLRAVPAAFSALPYPARHGRDLFAVETARMFARRKMLVLRPDALCRLDRVDCLVIPAETVTRDQFQISEAVCTRDIEQPEAEALARELFRSEYPLRLQTDGEWTLGPPSLVARSMPKVFKEAVAEKERRGALLLGLARKRRLYAVLEVHISAKSTAAEALRKAGSMGIKLYVATDDPSFSLTRFGRKIDGTISGPIGEAVRSLQRGGRTVCFVGRGASDGMFAADFSVAVRGEGEPPPFAAHVISPDVPRVLDTVLDACAAARTVSKQSSKLSLVSAVMGTLASSSGRPGAASGRVVAVMSAASLVSMINAVSRARSVGRHRPGIQDPTPWHALTPEGAEARLGSAESGLVPLHDAPSRVEPGLLYGLSRAVTQEMSNPLTPLLAMGAGVSALVGSKADAGIVAGVALINGLIGGVQRFKTERHISNLIQTAENKARVLRDGKVEICAASALCIGDVILLSRGEVVPADCRILESDGLEVDTSTLTGESLPVPKSAAPSYSENLADITSMLFEGNHVSAGSARALVTAVGDQTAMARASMLSVIDEERGGVEARLRELMNLTGPITIAAGAALIGAGMLRGKRIEDLVNTAVGLAVAAVPEGLPLLATAAQLAAAERLSLRGALVKNPRAIEALGRVDVLCMDKTGTLTEGRIALASVFDGEKVTPIDSLDARGIELLVAALHSAAEEDGTALDPLNAAVLRAADKHLDANAMPDESKRISMLPFDSGRGFEAVLTAKKRGARLYIKGAPELLISQAGSILLDKRTRFSGKIRRDFEAELEHLTAEGLRVIAVAEREIPGTELDGESPRTLMETPGRLTLLGLLAFRDPVRKGARDTVGKLSRAGVRTVMLTGDHPKTAAAIAKEAGLSMKEADVLEGGQLNAMNDEALERAVEETTVFARVSPAQKVRIIRAFERKKHIVGMVGDGANDAASMRAADAGIAVGLDCAESARASADIVLKEAHIGELFEAVVEGRAMWRSVRNAVSILVGGNLGEIAFTVAAGAVAARPPLSPRQFLVVNFLTDIAPSTAIALRPPSVFDLHSLREVGPDAALGAPLNREIASRAVCTSIGAWTAWTVGRLTGTRTRASTIALLGLVGSQLGQTLLSGGKNRAVVWTGLGSAALLGTMVQIPGLSHALGCTPIGPVGWTVAIGASIGSTLLSPIVDATVQFGADRLVGSPANPLLKAGAEKILSELKDLVEI